MNRIYRIIRRKSDGLLVVACEIAKSAVGGVASVATAATTVVTLGAAGGAFAAASDIVTATGSGATVTTANTTASVPVSVVNIATPNGSGVSHSTFDKFNVNSSGVILNNVQSGLTGQSGILGGSLSGNANITGSEANVVLLEVTNASNASRLAGALEVVRSRTPGATTAPLLTDVLIANPSGITINGASFLNTKNVILATGAVSSVSGTNISFNLSSNPLAIESAGTSNSLSATDLALISRQISVAGKIQATNLNIVTADGSATFAASDSSVTTSTTGADGGAITGYAIDTALLGGMYAGRITLIANEAGTGVRALGDMAAVGGTISITSAGQLVVGDSTSGADKTQLQARSIALASSSVDAAAGAVTLTNAELQAQATSSTGGALSVTTSGDLTIDKTSIASTSRASDGTGGTISLTARNLTDVSTATSRDTRSAGGALTINLTGAANLGNVGYSGNSLDIDLTALSLASNAQLSAKTTADILASTGNITLDGALRFDLGSSSIKASTGLISLTSTAILSVDDLVIEAASTSKSVTLASGATIAAAGDLTLKAKTISVDSNLSVGGALALQGTDSSSQATLGGTNANALASVGGNVVISTATTILNSKLAVTGGTAVGSSGTPVTSFTTGAASQISGQGGLTIDAASVTLNGQIVKSGAIDIDAATSLAINQGSSLVTQGSGAIALASADINNKGRVESAGTLQVGSGNTATLTNTGLLQASAAVTINVGSTGLALNKATIASTGNGRDLGIEEGGSTHTYEQTLSVDETQIGAIRSTGSTISVTAGNFINEGEVSASGALNLVGATNYKQMLAGLWAWGGTSQDYSSRTILMSPSASYDYANTGGVESYANDQYLLAGRANFTPTTTAASLTGTGGSYLNVGGTVSASGMPAVDVAARRVTTTIGTQEPLNIPSSNYPVTAAAPIVADGTTPTDVELASNNATWVVQIAPPNSMGLSNNTYSLFNVNTNGAIFNNMPLSESVTAVTQLSAVITANPKLTAPASVILNQVYSGSPSILNGFMEVAGRSADLLIANPYGIVCNNCGVINTGRLDLIVGSVNLANGAISSLTTNYSGNIATGKLSITGSGTDLTSAAVTSLIAPELVVDGSVNANELYVGLGGGVFSRNALASPGYYTRTSTTNSGSAEAMLVSELGGIYADSVTISSLSSDANPRLRFIGEVAANTGDLTIDADGLVMVRGRLSSAQAMSIVTTASSNSSSIANADIQLIDGALTAGTNMLLKADSGSLVFNGGQIYSFNNLTLDAKTLIDSATVSPAQFNNSRFSGGTLALNIDDTLVLNGTNWTADTFNVNGANLNMTVGQGTTLQALSLMDMNLRSLDNAGTIASQKYFDLDASASVLNQSGANLTSVFGSTLTTPTLTNAGNWVASSDTAQTGTTNWRVSSIQNKPSGVIASAQAWSIADFNGGATTTITNAGKINSEIALDATLSSLTNSGEMVLSLRDSAGNSDWTVGTLTNQVSGSIFAGGNWAVNSSGSRGTSLTNAGVLQGYRNLSLSFNSLALSPGKEISGALKGTAGDKFLLNITNNYTLDSLLFSGADLEANFDSGLTLNATAAIAGNGNVLIKAQNAGADIVNYGFLYAGGTLGLDAADDIGNFSRVSLKAGRTLGVSAVDGLTYIENQQVEQSRAEIRSGGNLTIKAGDIFVNSAEIRSGGAIDIEATTISNQPQRLSSDGFATDSPLTETVAKKLNFTFSETSVDSYSYPDLTTNYTYVSTWQEFNYYKDGAPVVRPVIIAQNTFNIRGATVNNYGGLIFASGASPASSTISATSSLTNDALALWRDDWTWTQTRAVEYIALGPLTYSDSTTGAYPTAGVRTYTDPGAAVIGATGTLNITGGSVTNVGALAPTSSTTTVAASGTLNPNGFNLAITLPTNPNGFFVTNRDPAARYLVEMNPKLQSGISTLGSDYLLANLSIDNDSTIKRLGDASYEAYLVEQQLIEATGKGVLDGFNDIAEVMKGFMENAVEQASTLDLEFGKPLTNEQLAKLIEPIIWMVEIEVEGQKVLAPKVYLPAAIMREISEQGAVLSAKDLTMDVASLDNLGGKIDAKNDLNITAQGNITNLSGSISGNNVAVTSKEGSITNETSAIYAGNDVSGSTQIGKTAEITARNNLSLTAAGDITNKGANVNAGGNAALDAGGNITFDTIEKVDRDYKLEGTGGLLTSGVSETKTKTTTQIGSGLNVGNNLTTRSGGDTTFAGTDVTVAGSADLQSGGNINIIARENSVESSTTSTTSGVGVGGGVYGTSKTTTDSLSVRNVGSNFNVGGDAKLDAKNDVTIQGSNVAIGGNAEINATNLNVLAGRDLDTTKSRTETTSFLGGEETEAAADGSETKGVTLAQTTVTDKSTLSQRSIGSALNIGGNAKIDVKKDVTLQGSELAAGGDVEVNAENIRLLAAQNIETSSERKQTTQIGLYASSESGASGEAGASTETSAEAGAESGSLGASANAKAGAGAGVGASGSASASASVDFAKVQINTKDTLDIKNTGSAIRSGGNTKLVAKDKLQLVGSELEAGGDVDLQAKNMSFEAAKDVHIEKTSSETTRIGLYADSGAEGEAKAGANAGAEAKAGAGVLGGDASAEASAEASASAEGSAKASVGIQAINAKKTELEGTTTAITSSIKSGGSISRTAKEKITDVGTNIEAAGDLNQSAETIESLAARNESFAEKSFEQTTVKLGLYVEAEASAEAKAGAKAEAKTGTSGTEASGEAGASVEAEAGARVGVEAKVNRLTESEKERSTQAVVSNIKVGGSVNSKSSGKTTFEGTNIEAGQDINVTANELEMKAAQDTNEKESSREEIDTRVAVAIGVGGSAEAKASANTDGDTEASAEAEGGVKVRAEMEASYAKENAQEKSTTAVTSTFKGGNIKLNTAGKTTIEGAALEASEGVTIDAESLDFKAAKNTSEQSESSTSVDASLKIEATIIGKAGAEAEMAANVAVGSSQEKSTEAVTGSINAANLTIKTKKDTRLEGTAIDVTDSAQIDAGGNIELAAARNTFEASANSTEVGASLSANSDADFAVGADVGVASSSEKSSDAVVGGIKTGGNLLLKSGKDINLEGTNIESGGDAIVAAANNVNFAAAKSTFESSSSEVNVSAGVSKEGSDVGVNVDVGVNIESERGTNAEAGSLSAKNLTIVAGNDVKLEGTALAAEENAAIAAGGSVDFSAARSTREASSLGVEVGVGFGKEEENDKKSGSLNLGVEVGNEKENIATAGSISAGQGISVSSGKNMSFEGTDLAAGDKIALSAGGNVDFKAAESTSSTTNVGVGFGVEKESETSTEDGEKEESDKTAVSGSLNLELANSKEQKASNLSAGAGGITIQSGGNVGLQGTQMATDGAATIDAQGKIIKTEAQSSSSEFGLGLEASMEVENKKTSPDPDAKKDDKEGGDDKSDAKSDDKAEPKADAKPDAKADTKAGEADADAAKEADDPNAVTEEQEKKKGVSGTLSFSSSAASQSVKIQAAGGSRQTQGGRTGLIAGTSQTISASISPDGSQTALVPGAFGKKVGLSGTDGSPMPDWVTFDPALGSVTAKPPADFSGTLDIVVAVPQADGSVRKIGMSVVGQN